MTTGRTGGRNTPCGSPSFFRSMYEETRECMRTDSARCRPVIATRTSKYEATGENRRSVLRFLHPGTALRRIQGRCSTWNTSRVVAVSMPISITSIGKVPGRWRRASGAAPAWRDDETAPAESLVARSTTRRGASSVRPRRARIPGPGRSLRRFADRRSRPGGSVGSARWSLYFSQVSPSESLYGVVAYRRDERDVQVIDGRCEG